MAKRTQPESEDSNVETCGGREVLERVCGGVTFQSAFMFDESINKYADELSKALIGRSRPRRQKTDYRVDIDNKRIIIRPAKTELWVFVVSNNDCYFQANGPQKKELDGIFTQINDVYLEVFSSLEVTAQHSIGIKFTDSISPIDSTDIPKLLQHQLMYSTQPNIDELGHLDGLTYRFDFDRDDRKIATSFSASRTADGQNKFVLDADFYSNEFSMIQDRYYEYMSEAYNLFVGPVTKLFHIISTLQNPDLLNGDGA